MSFAIVPLYTMQESEDLVSSAYVVLQSSSFILLFVRGGGILNPLAFLKLLEKY